MDKPVKFNGKVLVDRGHITEADSFESLFEDHTKEELAKQKYISVDGTLYEVCDVEDK